METKLISARFKKDEINVMAEIAKEEKTDKSTALRRIFSLGARQYKVEKAVKEYEHGKVGLGEQQKSPGQVFGK